MPAFLAEPGLPYWIDLLSGEDRKSRYFYSEVMGWEMTKQGDNFWLARAQGLPVAGVQTKPDDSQPDSWITSFLTYQLAHTVQEARDSGATVIVEPTEVPLGTMALLVDPSGGFFGLIEPVGEESFVSGGEPGTVVWHELTCVTNFAKTCRFYAELLDWDAETHTDPSGNEYMVASIEGAPFAGIWNAEGKMDKATPSFWQSYLGVKDIEETAKAVTETGGDIVQGPLNSSFGPLLIAADSTGAMVTFCEVPEPPEEELRESDPLENLDLSQFGIDLNPGNPFKKQQ